MCAALSTEPRLTIMPRQSSSFSIISIAASVVQTSPPRWSMSCPTAKRLPSSGYIHAGAVDPVPYVQSVVSPASPLTLT
jgi:hypothetical protein